MTELLLVNQVTKRFQGGPKPVQALHEVTLAVAAGELICLVGPSGSGKSTLLRIMGGLLQPDSGSVWFQGEPLTAPHEEIGFVFQKTNLMPWRTVLQNVLLPVEIQQGRPGVAEQERARQLLALMGLREFEDSYPGQLSGGMNQRVALARALFYQPQLLLMDEPFGALDALTRERLNLELLRLHADQARTIVLVTHDIAEAVFLADRIMVLSERPGQVMADLAVDLPRPRQISHLASPRFGELVLEVRRWIGEPVAV
jgi:NitT/TauT family transport system ATP-binding protein